MRSNYVPTVELQSVVNLYDSDSSNSDGAYDAFNDMDGVASDLGSLWLTSDDVYKILKKDTDACKNSVFRKLLGESEAVHDLRHFYLTEFSKLKSDEVVFLNQDQLYKLIKLVDKHKYDDALQRLRSDIPLGFFKACTQLLSRNQYTFDNFKHLFEVPVEFVMSLASALVAWSSLLTDQTIGMMKNHLACLSELNRVAMYVGSGRRKAKKSSGLRLDFHSDEIKALKVNYIYQNPTYAEEMLKAFVVLEQGNLDNKKNLDLLFEHPEKALVLAEQISQESCRNHQEQETVQANRI